MKFWHVMAIAIALAVCEALWRSFVSDRFGATLFPFATGAAYGAWAHKRWFE